ncbi:MAG: sialate O-acetylesterase [Phycisphaerae bacterium]|nr:sialate O-acetylesterase [Phycisphaerae bacterium]
MRQSMRRQLAAGLMVLGVAVGWTAEVRGDIRLPHVIGSHMVIQRDLAIPIWGWAKPGEEVQVLLANRTATATADAGGRWLVKLEPLPAGGPHTLTVAGFNTIELTDVLIGDVWLCSGQSNMEMSIKSVEGGPEAVAQANHPRIRILQVPWRISPTPIEDIEIEWRPCTPETISTGGAFNAGFSAIGYFFGLELHRELDVPIGLIDSSWGGTRIEPWTPRAGFAMVPTLQDIVKLIDEATPHYHKAVSQAVEEFERWTPLARKHLDANEPVPAPPAWPQHQLNQNTQPTAIYNGMIHPLVPFTIRGAIWYQGESNLKDGMVYADKMRALIGGWRSAWGQGLFPFYFVQLAPFRYGNEDPQFLARLWEAQTASLSIRNSGMAVTVDIGDVQDIHPRNKRDVGHRLALWALAKSYGRQGLVYSGPLFQSAEVEGDAMRVRFAHTGGGLASRDGQPLNWFQIAGEDQKFHPAEAVIDGATLLVRSPQVIKPVAVRFAWHQEANPNLMNKEGLPASPFRSDSW